MDVLLILIWEVVKFTFAVYLQQQYFRQTNFQHAHLL
jgi:hypothetical protein